MVTPGVGKSKILKKALKRANKRRRKLGLPKIKRTKLKLTTFQPCDMAGYLVPSHVVNRLPAIKVDCNRKAWLRWASINQ